MSEWFNWFIICKICFLASYSAYQEIDLLKKQRHSLPDISLIVSRISQIPWFFPDLPQFPDLEDTLWFVSEANLKQIERCYNCSEANYSKFFKKGQKECKFWQKFEMNLKWIWNKF